jgi:SAM-dependent methyltransferase
METSDKNTMISWLQATTSDPMQPLATALQAHMDNGKAVEIEFRRDDGEIYLQSSDDYFTAPQDLSELEAIALDTSVGPVLDIGSGCGRLALLLQARGIEVSALDICDDMVNLMRQRGVTQAECGDAFTIDRGHYQTILMLMETVGLAGDIDGLGRLLDNLQQRLTADGQIICDACPLIETGQTASVRMQIRYENCVGTPFHWLYVDAQSFAAVAARHGLTLDIGYHDEESGHYLARLRREDDSVNIG